MRPDQAPALLLVHGAWHGAWCWEEKFAPRLRELGHTVATMDLPGHGGSGGARIPWFSVRQYVDAVQAEMARLGGPCVVVGHSMGGFVVQKLMERRPANLAGAGLVAAAPPFGVNGVVRHLLVQRPWDLLRASLTANLYHLVREPEMARALFYSHTMTDEEAADYWARLQNESFRAFLDMLVLDLPKPRKVAAGLPRWVVGGGQDQIFPPQVVQRTAAAYRCKARIYPDMAHNLMLDHGWARVAEDLSRWVSTTPMEPHLPARETA